MRRVCAGILIIVCCGVAAAAQGGRPYSVSDEQVGDLLRRLEERADAFRSVVDIVLEVSRLDGTPREGRIDLLAEEFERGVDALRRRFDARASTAADVERVLGSAARLEGPLTRALADGSLHPDASLRERTATEWALLKSSLKNLADFYGIKTDGAGGASVYTVRPGDTLSRLARRFGTTVEAILEANPSIENRDTIYAGQRLSVPAGANSGDVFEGTAGVTEKRNGAAGVATLRDVRAAAHPNYDRVVFEFRGNETPGYRVEYVDRPVRRCGSGEATPVRGDGWLKVTFNPARAHDEAGRATVSERARTFDYSVIRELKITCDFEADLSWVIGASSPNRYRVLELSDPARVVVDIRH